MSSQTTVVELAVDFAKLLKATKGRPRGLGQHTGILSWSRLYARELGPVRVNELTVAMVDAWYTALTVDFGAAKARDARKRLNRILLYAKRVGLQVGPAPATPRPLSNESTIAEVSADYVRTLESRGKKYTKRPKTWERHYMGTLGGVRIVDLTEAMIDAWHEALIISCGPAKADRAKKSGLYPVLRHAHMRGLAVLVERPVDASAPTPSLTAASTVAQVCADLVRALRERAHSEDEEIGRQNFQAPLSWSRHYMRGLGPVRVSDVTASMIREWYASLEAEHQPRTAKAQLRKLGSVLQHARKAGVPMPGLSTTLDSRGRLRLLEPEGAPELPTTAPLSSESSVAEVCADLVQTLRSRAEPGVREVPKDAFRGPLRWSRTYMGALGDVRVRELTPERIGEWEARLATHHNQRIAEEARRWLNRVVSHARVRGVLAPERAPAGTVLAVAEDWQRTLQARYDDPDEGICRSYLSVPGSLIKRLGALALLQVSELTVENVGAWYCELLKQYTPGKAYTSVVYLRSMIAHGRRIGFTIGDVTREIKRPEDLALPPSLQRKPAETMAYADTDATLMSLLRADLIAVLGGQEREVRLPVPKAQRGCEAFIAYARPILADTSALERAMEAFVKANLRLVVSIARGYRYGPLPLHDLIQEGNIGLIKVIGRFDPRRGFRFSTYGSWWIRHAIGRAIADRGRDVRLPVHLLDRQFKLAKARREFEKGHGRAPTGAELSAILKISEAKILLADRASGVVSNLGEPINDDGTTLAELIRDEPDRSMAEELDLKVVRAHFVALLAAMTPIEADIVRRRFGFDEDEMTLKELARISHHG